MHPEEKAHLQPGLASQTESVIMGGEAITSSLSDVFQIITTEVSDSFRAAGFGLRHTFPGSTIPESDPPHLGRLLMPSWMMRIDYIFHSDDWATLSARTARMTVYLTTRGWSLKLAKASKPILLILLVPSANWKTISSLITTSQYEVGGSFHFWYGVVWLHKNFRYRSKMVAFT